MRELMEQMGGTIQKVNDAIEKVNAMIDETKDNLARTIVSMAAMVDNANGLLISVSDDVKKMAKSGVKLSDDAPSEIMAGVRAGRGSLGSFVTDDELYVRVNEITKQALEIATNANNVVTQAKKTLEGFDSKDGPVQGMTADVKQTMNDARAAVAGLAENMDALKHKIFLLRGFFKGRGYFDLAQVSPADYPEGRAHEGQRSPSGPRLAARRRVSSRIRIARITSG